MGKRKKVKNVNINNGEINPVTIGYLNNRKKGPLLIIFIFAIIIASLVYMPEITNFLQKYLHPNAYRERMEENTDYVIIEEAGVIKSLKSNTTITVSKVKFSDFSLNGNTLLFKISNATELENFFIITYDANKNELETIKILDASATSVSLSETDVVYIAIKIIENYEEPKQEEKLFSCSKDRETYSYEFVNDQLINVSYSYELTKNGQNDQEYDEAYQKYSEEAGLFPIAGIKKIFSNQTNGFIFKIEYDLSNVSMVNIEDENVFSYRESKDTINSTMTEKGYTCN